MSGEGIAFEMGFVRVTVVHTKEVAMTCITGQFNLVLKLPQTTTQTTIRIPFAGVSGKRPCEYTICGTSKFAVIYSTHWHNWK
jgi:hypothetical protein